MARVLLLNCLALRHFPLTQLAVPSYAAVVPGPDTISAGDVYWVDFGCQLRQLGMHCGWQFALSSSIRPGCLAGRGTICRCMLDARLRACASMLHASTGMLALQFLVLMLAGDFCAAGPAGPRCRTNTHWVSARSCFRPPRQRSAEIYWLRCAAGP